MMAFKVGFSQVPLDPPTGIPLAKGTSVAECERDTLYARAVVIEQGEDTAAILSCDLYGVTGRFVSDVRRIIKQITRGRIEELAVMIVATHTPYSPALPKMFPIGPASSGEAIHMTYDDAGLTHELAEELAAAVVHAWSKRSPASIKVGSASVPAGTTHNRRPWDAYAGDPDGVITTIEFLQEGGERCVLYNFACHPVLQELQNCYSADLFGMVAIEMETRLGGKIICLPLNGPSGNVNPGPGGSSSEYNQEAADYNSQEIVQTVAAGIETALERGEAIECNLVRAGVKLVSIPLADPTVVERFPHLRFTRDSPNYALNTQVQVVRLGELAVVGLPGEPMVSVGQRVKEMAIQVGFRTVIVAALANDFIGYYFLPESFDTGGSETLLCAHRDEGTVILDGVEQILSKMRECED